MKIIEQVLHELDPHGAASNELKAAIEEPELNVLKILSCKVKNLCRGALIGSASIPFVAPRDALIGMITTAWFYNRMVERKALD